jgi:hypothetical protein
LANSKGYSADDVLPLSACKVLPADDGVERMPGKPSPIFTFPDGINNLGSVLLLGLPASKDVLLLSRVNPFLDVGVEAVSDSEVIGWFRPAFGVLGDRSAEDGLLEPRILTVEHISFRTSESRKSAFSLAGLMSTSFLGVIANSSSTRAKERREGTRCWVVLGRTERDERRMIVDR